MYSEIKNDLITLPMQIFKAREEYIKKTHIISEKKLIAKNLKLTIETEVYNETNAETGKKIYTNEKSRSNEITSRLGFSLDYIKVVEESDELSLELEKENIYILFLVDRFSTAKSLTRM